MIAKDLRRLSKLYIKALAMEMPAPHTEYMAEAMMYLASQNQKATQNQLINRLEVDRRSLVSMLDELVKLGYLRVELDPKNINRHLFDLTDSGRALLPEIEKAIESANKQLIGEMGEGSLEAFLLNIRLMEANLKKRLSGYNFKE